MRASRSPAAAEHAGENRRRRCRPSAAARTSPAARRPIPDLGAGLREQRQRAELRIARRSHQAIDHFTLQQKGSALDARKRVQNPIDDGRPELIGQVATNQRSGSESCPNRSRARHPPLPKASRWGDAPGAHPPTPDRSRARERSRRLPEAPPSGLLRPDQFRPPACRRNLPSALPKTGNRATGGIGYPRAGDAGRALSSGAAGPGVDFLLSGAVSSAILAHDGWHFPCTFGTPGEWHGNPRKS